jgi:hypothetical protein
MRIKYGMWGASRGYMKKALRNAKELIGISIFMEHYNIALPASAERERERERENDTWKLVTK